MDREERKNSMAEAITVIMGSPREGNSDKLAQAFISGAEESGKKIYSVVIRELNINGCRGCEYCYLHNGSCIQNDDMRDVYTYLDDSKIVVFATPIYYQSFPSQLKALIDRLYVTENRSFSVEKAILLSTYATPGAEMAVQTINYFKVLIKYLGWENGGIITVSGMDEVDDIVGNDALQEAKKLGKNIL